MGNEAIKIEKGVPIPVGLGNGGKYAAAFAAMKPGDSFEVEKPEQRNTVLSSFSHWRKKTKSLFKLASRRQSNGKYRFWMVAP